MVARRVFLAGALAGLAQTALAGAPTTSLRPSPRPGPAARPAAPTVAALLESAGLGGRVGFAVADARTGAPLEGLSPDLALPPASVAKSVTTAYGLDRLGPGFRFHTRLVAGGPLRNGRLEGDLWLVGGGDPNLGTDQLAQMAQGLRESGLREVTGRLMLASGSLPHVRAIDPEQPDHVGYNPAISGLNLNFNRVHFEWVAQSGGYAVAMDARSDRIRPPVTRQRIRIVDRDMPLFTYAAREGREDWTVARAALGNGGSRWLPVRQPHLYAAEVFMVLARANGLVLTGPVEGGAPPRGAVLAEYASEPLEEMLRGMMRWSTNITAEAVGLRASIAGGTAPGGLAASARAMNGWMAARLGVGGAQFVDHSGLGEASRISTEAMTAALVALGAGGMVRRLMRDHAMQDAQGQRQRDHPVRVSAKTGTLNFVSTLAGYARTPSGRELAFAIFCADLDRRARLRDPQMERPEGGQTYNRRAKALQQALIERWAAVHG